MEYLTASFFLACAACAPPSGEGTVSQAIFKKALTAEGILYASGGGSCNSLGGYQALYHYGNIGYGCSGLVYWTIYPVTGRDLSTEGL